MKPPWKFFADLVSGRKSSDMDEPSQKGGNGGLIEAKALPAPVIEHKPAETVVVEPPEAVAEAVASTPEETVSADVTIKAAEAPAPAAELSQSVADPDVLAVIAEPAKPARIKASTPVKPRSAVAPAQSEVGSTPAPVAEAVRSVVDEATILDREITDLRAQLAQKLRLQNAQLKKMLERFERS